MPSTMKIQDQAEPVTADTAPAEGAPVLVERAEVTDLSTDGFGVCDVNGYCA